MSTMIRVRPLIQQDIESITAIYNHYILNSTITFEEKAITPDVMEQRINTILERDLPWLVAEENSEIIGYAYAGIFKDRSAYRFTSEITVYVRPDIRQKGVGTQLYKELFEQLKGKVRTCVGCITLPNPASIALHEKFGMKPVGTFENVGFKFNQWLSVGYWQCHLED
ncbi:MAG: GNAT family N-acetyltransferase [Pseudomonadota bacterium]|nr:GNAT family N-acetyltransferase [Pseudomonadota bacterium]|tara:strand:+ start:397 stop:900 length:504 start_codon:yes stop_codon:yes gene_type:complete